jgi:hypothetical protein
MFVIAAVIAATAIFGENRRRAGQKKARKEGLEDAKQARKAEAFAKTEGEGTGNLGQISLELDDEVKDKNLSNLRV